MSDDALSPPVHFLLGQEEDIKSTRQVKRHSNAALAMLVEQGQTAVYCQSSAHK